jgi:hypothetical protein
VPNRSPDSNTKGRAQRYAGWVTVKILAVAVGMVLFGGLNLIIAGALFISSVDGTEHLPGQTDSEPLGELGFRLFFLTPIFACIGGVFGLIVHNLTCGYKPPESAEDMDHHSQS